MSFLSDWDDILDSLEAQRKKYGGTSIGASASMSSSGKGFRFPDEAAANKIIARFEERARSMRARKRLIGDAKRELERKFSADEVSEGYAQKAMDSLDKLDELNESAFRYAQRYAEKIETAKRKKHGDEGGIGGGLSKIMGSVV